MTADTALLIVAIVIYLAGACACRLIAYGNEPQRWWMPLVCMVWPVAGVLRLICAAGVWIVMGGRR